MNGLALKIGDQWARLSQGTSITVTEKSAVFDDGNAFSIPFQLNAEMNRHLLGNATEVSGVSFYEAIDRKPAVLYVQGIPLFHGQIRLDSEEAAIEDGCIDVNLESGNLTLDDLIADMNCRDVPLKDKIILGEKLDDMKVYLYPVGTTFKGYDKTPYVESYYPDVYQRMQVGTSGTDATNVVNPYPIAPFCNIRICYKKPDKNGEGEDCTEIDSSLVEYQEKQVDKVTFSNYIALDVDRKMSSPCFYVLYFLDCLFRHIGVAYSNGISSMEDMNRLAFVNMDFCYTLEDSGRTLDAITPSTTTKGDQLINFSSRFTRMIGGEHFNFKSKDKIYNCIATSDNFPDVDVTEVMDALKTGFGVRFIMDKGNLSVRSVYMKDILRSNEVVQMNVVIHEVTKTDINTKGFRMTYNGGDDDTSYNYIDYSKVVITDRYNYILSKISNENKNTYIDERNGNAYRIKIDSDAESSSDANAALFEVGAFGDATYGDCSDEELVEEVEVGFTPVTMNDVGGKDRAARASQSRRSQPIDTSTNSTNRTYSDEENNDQTFAFFLDIDMMYPSFPPFVTCTDYFTIGQQRELREGGIRYTQFEMQRYDETRSATKVENVTLVRADGTSTTTSRTIIKKADKFDNKSPIHSYDCGLMLGIMRGPGNEAGVEDIEEDYDEEGNYKYVTTGKKSAFHSDICDNYNRLFDYNGTEQGGVDVSGRFSLKLRAEKPNPEGGFFPITDVNMQKRGLFDKFYAEYAYFVTHRKLVKMKLRMELADLMQIDWTKRYRIGNYTGFINKYEYTVTDEGVGEISMEMYVL